MGTHYVWVTGLECERGHDIRPQSRERADYRGYPKESVPLDVAEDLRDHPFYCPQCTAGISFEAWQQALDATDSRDADDGCIAAAAHLGLSCYRLRSVGPPRSVCENCGRESACGCYRAVAVEIEKVPREYISNK